MRALPLLLLLIPAANAAEFKYEGMTVRSVRNEQITQCQSYSVIVAVEQFPQEVDGAERTAKIIPQGMTLRHNETDRYVAADVLVTLNGRRLQLPSVAQLLAFKPQLHDIFPRAGHDALYLPISPAACLANGFSVTYWIGGNGAGADRILKFAVTGDELSLPGLLTADELRTLTKTVG